MQKSRRTKSPAASAPSASAPRPVASAASGLAADHGLVAIGGDLSQARLLAAYRSGLFPWSAAGEPLMWWSPNPRCVLFPEKFRVSRSLAKSMRRGGFEFSLDADFAQVIRECAMPRGGKHGDSTWITAGMMRAYNKLHRAGIAHSAEVRRGGELVGGLYGVAIGGAFFGESMFSRARDASKVALARLIAHLLAWEFSFIDCQLVSPHLLSLGAEGLARDEFLARLQPALKQHGRPGNWAGAEI